MYDLIHLVTLVVDVECIVNSVVLVLFRYFVKHKRII